MSLPDSPAHRTAAAYLALRDQDQVAAHTGHALAAWHFDGDRRLTAVLEARLTQTEWRPSPRRAFATLAPRSDLPTLPPVDADRAHSRTLCAATPQGYPDLEATTRVRADLARLGRWQHWHGTEAWRAQSFDPDPTRDAAASALWAAWWTGDCWGGRDRWESLFLPAAVQVFRAVAAARELPAEVSARAVADLREAFFFRMIGGDPSGWRELAARVLETAAPDPVSRVRSALDAHGAQRAALCLSCRGSWRQTVAAVFPELGEVLARARALAGDADDHPAPSWQALLDLHVALRLLRSWSMSGPPPRSGHPFPEGSDYTIITQNRGRARGRLRAVLAARPAAHIVAEVLELDALAHRTEVAVRRFAWAWAWQELAYDFSFDLHRAVTPGCQPAATTVEPLSDDARQALPSWLLLVVYRDRLDHMVRWVQTGSTGDRDSTWARLLTEALPRSLKDPPVPGARAASYGRLRAELGLSLHAYLAQSRGRLARAATLRSGRSLKRSFIELHEDDWHPSVPMLRSGFPTARAAAKRAVSRIDALLEDPTHVQRTP